MDNLQVKKSTIIRTVLLIVSIINLILTNTGHSILPFSDEQIEDFISTAFTIIMSIWAWWKNNSFTKPALAADEYLKNEK